MHLIVDSYPFYQSLMEACQRKSLPIEGRVPASILPALKLLRLHDLEPDVLVVIREVITITECLAVVVSPYSVILALLGTNVFGQIIDRKQ